MCQGKPRADGAVQAIGNAELDFSSSALLRAGTTVVQYSSSQHLVGLMFDPIERY
jgi:hypothetical protein